MADWLADTRRSAKGLDGPGRRWCRDGGAVTVAQGQRSRSSEAGAAKPEKRSRGGEAGAVTRTRSRGRSAMGRGPAAPPARPSRPMIAYARTPRPCTPAPLHARSHCGPMPVRASAAGKSARPPVAAWSLRQRSPASAVAVNIAPSTGRARRDYGASAPPRAAPPLVTAPASRRRVSPSTSSFLLPLHLVTRANPCRKSFPARPRR